MLLVLLALLLLPFSLFLLFFGIIVLLYRDILQSRGCHEHCPGRSRSGSRVLNLIEQETIAIMIIQAIIITITIIKVGILIPFSIINDMCPQVVLCICCTLAFFQCLVLQALLHSGLSVRWRWGRGRPPTLKACTQELQETLNPTKP